MLSFYYGRFLLSSAHLCHDCAIRYFDVKKYYPVYLNDYFYHTGSKCVFYWCHKILKSVFVFDWKVLKSAIVYGIICLKNVLEGYYVIQKNIIIYPRFSAIAFQQGSGYWRCKTNRKIIYYPKSWYRSFQKLHLIKLCCRPTRPSYFWKGKFRWRLIFYSQYYSRRQNEG